MFAGLYEAIVANGKLEAEIKELKAEKKKLEVDKEKLEAEIKKHEAIHEKYFSKNKELETKNEILTSDKTRFELEAKYQTGLVTLWQNRCHALERGEVAIADADPGQGSMKRRRDDADNVDPA